MTDIRLAWVQNYLEWLDEEATEGRKRTEANSQAFKAGWDAALDIAEQLIVEKAKRSLDKRRNHEADAILDIIIPIA